MEEIGTGGVVRKLNNWAQRKFGCPGSDVCEWTVGKEKVGLKISEKYRSQIEQSISTLEIEEPIELREVSSKTGKAGKGKSKTQGEVAAKRRIATRFLALLEGFDKTILQQDQQGITKRQWNRRVYRKSMKSPNSSQAKKVDLSFAKRAGAPKWTG